VGKSHDSTYDTHVSIFIADDSMGVALRMEAGGDFVSPMGKI
jgi:hypothetical protein